MGVILDGFRQWVFRERDRHLPLHAIVGQLEFFVGHLVDGLGAAFSSDGPAQLQDVGQNLGPGMRVRCCASVRGYQVCSKTMHPAKLPHDRIEHARDMRDEIPVVGHRPGIHEGVIQPAPDLFIGKSAGLERPVAHQAGD